jgi:hypothetical protein
LSCAKLEELEVALVVRMKQVNMKKETAHDEVNKGQAKVLEQQISVTKSVHRNYHVFCSKG